VTLSLIGLDDVNGQCGQGPYPLLRAVANVFGLIDQTRTGMVTPIISSITPPETRVLCSISAKADTYRNPIRFTLEKIDARLCTHLLINYQSTLLTPSAVQQLKSRNADLKILLTIPTSDAITMERLEELLQRQNADGVDLYISRERSSRNITESLQVNASSINDESYLSAQIIQRTLSKKYLLAVSAQVPTDAQDQASFFETVDLHRYGFLLSIRDGLV
jgi:hypothetical protein